MATFAIGLRPGLASHAANLQRPVWLGFGLNGPAQGDSRFPLTLAMSGRKGKGGSLDFQRQVGLAIRRQLQAQGDFVEFLESVDMDSGLLLGAAVDYENVIPARLGSSSFIVLHLIGHGAVLDFDRSRGWKMLSSFPFPVTLLRESSGGDTKAEAMKYLMDAYVNGDLCFASSFARTAKRVAPTWKENARGFNIRVTSSQIHPDVAAKLRQWGISRNVTDTWLGHLASAAICDGLGVSVVPFVETQALGKFTYMFSDRLVAQNVTLPDIADIDLRISVSLRNAVRDIKYRKQTDRWEVIRIVVFDINVADDRDQPVLSLRMGYSDEQPDVVASPEEVVPARDAHFFDMAVYRGLQGLFFAIDRRDQAGLERLFVKVDAEQQQRLENFRRIWRKAG